MPLPPLVVSGQVIAASHINAIRNYLPLMADGSAATPGFRFEDDPDTGLHRSASDTLAIVTGGTICLSVSSASAKIEVPLALGSGVTPDAGVVLKLWGISIDGIRLHRSNNTQYAFVTVDADSSLRLGYWTGSDFGFVKAPGLRNCTDDVEAASFSVPVDGIYRTGSILKVRVS